MVSNYFHSVILDPERCIGCTYCLKICPTEAIRLKNGKASIIPERCIDCGECIRVCPNHAKSAITDNLDILKKFKYNIALTLPIIYGQFNRSIPPLKILSAIKSLGFDEVVDTSAGSDIVDIIGRLIINSNKVKPVINSSCPAILRLIQVRFPELLENIMDIETPVEITARLAKNKAAEKTGLSMEDIGVILITPCTARVTSIKNPLGIDLSYVNATIALKDIFGPVLKASFSTELSDVDIEKPTRSGLLWYSTGGQITTPKGETMLSVDGINNAISILEEIEMGRLDNISFVEITACPGSCLGGPLVVENRYIALNRLVNIAKDLDEFKPSSSDIDKYVNLYKSGFIKLTSEIKPRAVMSLDNDIRKSIEKMDTMQSIINKLPGINCGICGSPTCRTFAEDIVTGNRSDSICPVMDIMSKIK